MACFCSRISVNVTSIPSIRYNKQPGSISTYGTRFGPDQVTFVGQLPDFCRTFFSGDVDSVCQGSGPCGSTQTCRRLIVRVVRAPRLIFFTAKLAMDLVRDVKEQVGRPVSQASRTLDLYRNTLIPDPFASVNRSAADILSSDRSGAGVTHAATSTGRGQTPFLGKSAPPRQGVAGGLASVTRRNRGPRARKLSTISGSN
jgi:hypothetical protein